MNEGQHRGRTNHHAGLSAEDSILRQYRSRGLTLRDRRWRGQSGEIDLVLAAGRMLVFAEVKKSRSHASAATRLSPRQIRRITGAAAEYLDHEPLGSLTESRFDLALVNGIGEVRIIENAFAETGPW